jgi:hypothetical protein
MDFSHYEDLHLRSAVIAANSGVGRKNDTVLPSGEFLETFKRNLPFHSITLHLPMVTIKLMY